jgi:hypothetical protein
VRLMRLRAPGSSTSIDLRTWLGRCASLGLTDLLHTMLAADKSADTALLYSSCFQSLARLRAARSFDSSSVIAAETARTFCWVALSTAWVSCSDCMIRYYWRGPHLCCSCTRRGLFSKALLPLFSSCLTSAS